jgi:hypothetical protein
MRFRDFMSALSIAAALLVCGSTAQAVTLWDQSTIDINGPSIPASNSGGFNGLVVHSVNDVTVPASGWVVTKITQWYSCFNFNWIGGISQGYINVFPKTGGLPTQLPVAIQSPMSCVQDAAQTALLQQAVISISANVNIALPPGEYWIGLTPTRAASINGINQMWSSAMVGAPVASYDMLVANPTWANIRGNYDGAFMIEGELPVPAESNTWGGIKSLYR